MAEKMGGVDPNKSNPNNPGQPNQAPVDPSNTSYVGQKVEQEVVDTKEGITEQSTEWEDSQERNIPGRSPNNRLERYLKDPSPEETNIDNAQQGS